MFKLTVRYRCFFYAFPNFAGEVDGDGEDVDLGDGEAVSNQTRRGAAPTSPFLPLLLTTPITILTITRIIPLLELPC